MIQRKSRPPSILDSLIAKRKSPPPPVVGEKTPDYSSAIRNIQDSLLGIKVDLGNLYAEIDSTKQSVSSLPKPDKPLNYDIELLSLKTEVEGLERSLSKISTQGAKDYDKKIDDIYREINRVIGAVNALPARRDTGHLRFKPDMGGWNDYIVVATSISIAHASAPALTVFRDGIQKPAFPGTGVLVKEVWVDIHIEHDYKAGTNLYPHIHWSHIVAAPTGNVKWGVEYTLSKGHQVGTFGATTTVYIVQTTGIQYTHHIGEVSDADSIPFANVEPDTIVSLRVFRDPADAEDTFEADAYLYAVDLHYQSDGSLTTGKVSPFTKVSN